MSFNGNSNMQGLPGYSLGVKVLNRVAQLSISDLDASALTANLFTPANLTSAPTLARRKRGDQTFPQGMIAGQVVAVRATGKVAPFRGTAGESIIGIAVNDSIGQAFEAASGLASGKATYICGAGSVVKVDVFEGDISAYVPGAKVYADVDTGLLTVTAPASGDNAVIGVVLNNEDLNVTIQMRL